ncbi:MAG: peptide deformylase [Actinobacteria bacterium]|nr:peptide deformylase [Actinomycetota bacterium]
MAVKTIRKIGDPVLRKISEKVEKIDKEILLLIDDMIDTINSDEYNAVGLAAVQIGVLKRVIVINWGKIEVYINPEIKIIGKEEEEQHEGCLSLYSMGCMLKRPKKIQVTALTPKSEKVSFKVEGMLARIFLHEVDHLDGKLFIDYLDSETKRELMVKISEKM